MNPQIAVVGRPNVGKSSLVNRLAGERIAVVEEHRGVTRDRKTVTAEWKGISFDLVDTGGWLNAGDELEQKVSEQSEKAIPGSALVLFVVDVNTGVTDEDLEAAKWIRRSHGDRRVLLVVNKVDTTAQEASAWDFLSLGLGDPFLVSALHGRGSGDLLDTITDALEADSKVVTTEPTVEHDGLRIALVGRPNVGKSTLFNSIIGENRSVVHDMPGTTRDAVDTVVESPIGTVTFIDTAGMRRKAKTDEGLETYSVVRALDALDRSNIVLLVIDATVGATGQDQRLAERIAGAGCPVIIILNKWELLDADARLRCLGELNSKLSFLSDAPVIKTTALSGKGVHKIWPALQELTIGYESRIPTGVLNRAIKEIQVRHPSPTGKVRYIVQGASQPPTFTIFASGRIDQTYLRYIERSLREKFEFGSTPVKIRVRLD